MVLSYLNKKFSSNDELGDSEGKDVIDESTITTTTTTTIINLDPEFVPLPPLPPPQEMPERFLRAGKGDPVEGRRRYEETLKWRKENRIDTILTRPHPHFDLIKSNYPHYYHLRGHSNEPVYIEQPPKANMRSMRDGGITLEDNLHYYAMITEFQWQYIEQDDMARSITILDLDGMGMLDFVGEIVTYVRKCTAFTGQHYPERAGFVLILNAPGWFETVWNVVKPLIDDVTLEKISILGTDKEKVLKALQARIPIENIPPEYGGTSIPLGQSPEEQKLKDLIHHNNAVFVNGDLSCGGRGADCEFCSFVPVRSY